MWTEICECSSVVHTFLQAQIKTVTKALFFPMESMHGLHRFNRRGSITNKIKWSTQSAAKNLQTAVTADWNNQCETEAHVELTWWGGNQVTRLGTCADLIQTLTRSWPGTDAPGSAWSAVPSGRSSLRSAPHTSACSCTSWRTSS